jgi:predicted amidohydrolase
MNCLTALFGAVLIGAFALTTAAAETESGPADTAGPGATPRPATVKVAAVQCSSDLGAVEANREKLTKLVGEAAGNGAKIIVLPEAAITGYLSQDLRTNWHIKGRPLDGAFDGDMDPSRFAETVPGPSTEHFAALAKKLGVYITVPLVEKEQLPEKAARKPRLFNTVCLVSPRGELVAHYRKLTPWPHPEQSWATDGDRGVQTYDTEYGRVGLAICFDIHTILPRYKPHKIWALLYPIAWVDDSHPAEWFWHKLPDRVGRFGHYVIGANWSVDEEQPWYGYGFSTVISPEGKVVATAKSLHGSEIVYADIETEKQ